jgi:Fe-S oxidoreductase
MFKQELPLMYPDDPDVQKVKANIYDPFEYLVHRHKAGLLNIEFKQPLGKVVWQVPCHQRVQNIGPKTRDVLALVPDTQVEMIERCSGHTVRRRWNLITWCLTARWRLIRLLIAWI